jgi:hypothetical protein
LTPNTSPAIHRVGVMCTSGTLSRTPWLHALASRQVETVSEPGLDLDPGYPAAMPLHYHVTSVLNRESVSRSGIDWQRLGAAPGIAGSRRPEQQGCFLVADESMVDWFVGLNNTGGAVGVWEVHGIAADDLVQSRRAISIFLG